MEPNAAQTCARGSLPASSVGAAKQVFSERLQLCVQNSGVAFVVLTSRCEPPIKVVQRILVLLLRRRFDATQTNADGQRQSAGPVLPVCWGWRLLGCEVEVEVEVFTKP